MADLSVMVEWMDGDGNTWRAPQTYRWPASVPLPQRGDTLSWPLFMSRLAEVTERTWALSATEGPVVIIRCDLGEHSGALLARDREEGTSA